MPFPRMGIKHHNFIKIHNGKFNLHLLLIPYRGKLNSEDVLSIDIDALRAIYLIITLPCSLPSK